MPEDPDLIFLLIILSSVFRESIAAWREWLKWKGPC